jgi:16S rRNA processing protein RimM
VPRLVVGLVRGLHGLRGVVRVEPLTDDPGRFVVGTCLTRENDPRPLTIAWSSADGPGYLVRFDEITTREDADELRGVYLEGQATSVLPGDAYYWHEVVGVPVRTTAGEDLGSIADVFRAGGAEVYAVRGGARGEVLVPATRAFVRTFRPREGLIEVDAEALGLEELRVRRPRGRLSSRLGHHRAADGDAPGA